MHVHLDRHQEKLAHAQDRDPVHESAPRPCRWYAAEPKRMIEVENLVLEENLVSWVMGQAKTTDKQANFNELLGNN